MPRQAKDGQCGACFRSTRVIQFGPAAFNLFYCRKCIEEGLRNLLGEELIEKMKLKPQEDVLIQELADGSAAISATDTEMRNRGYKKSPDGWVKR